MTKQEIDKMKYKVCCPFCENERCVRGTDECEAELWAKDQLKIEPQESEVKE